VIDTNISEAPAGRTAHARCAPQSLVSLAPCGAYVACAVLSAAPSIPTPHSDSTSRLPSLVAGPSASLRDQRLPRACCLAAAGGGCSQARATACVYNCRRFRLRVVEQKGTRPSPLDPGNTRVRADSSPSGAKRGYDRRVPHCRSRGGRQPDAHARNPPRDLRGRRPATEPRLLGRDARAPTGEAVDQPGRPRDVPLLLRRRGRDARGQHDVFSVDEPAGRRGGCGTGLPDHVPRTRGEPRLLGGAVRRARRRLRRPRGAVRRDGPPLPRPRRPPRRTGRRRGPRRRSDDRVDRVRPRVGGDPRVPLGDAVAQRRRAHRAPPADDGADGERVRGGRRDRRRPDPFRRERAGGQVRRRRRDGPAGALGARHGPPRRVPDADRRRPVRDARRGGVVGVAPDRADRPPLVPVGVLPGVRGRPLRTGH